MRMQDLTKLFVNVIIGKTGKIKSGVVQLDAEDVGALPDSTVVPTKTSELINDIGFVDAAGAAAAAPVQSVNGQTGAVELYESGTTGVWTWRKWSDGLLELQRFYNGPPTTGSHYTTVNGFYGYYVTGFTFPSDAKPISNDYSIMADWAIGTGFSIFCGPVSSKAVTGFTLYALSTASGQSVVKIGIYIRAKWK